MFLPLHDSRRSLAPLYKASLTLLTRTIHRLAHYLVEWLKFLNMRSRCKRVQCSTIAFVVVTRNTPTLKNILGAWLPWFAIALWEVFRANPKGHSKMQGQLYSPIPSTTRQFPDQNTMHHVWQVEQYTSLYERNGGGWQDEGVTVHLPLPAYLSTFTLPS